MDTVPKSAKKWEATVMFLVNLFFRLNGLFLFATDVINKVLGDSANGTLCDILNDESNQVSLISYHIFYI